MSDYKEVIPEAEEKDYLKQLLKIIDKYSVDLIMPSSGYDIFPISENKDILHRHGIIPVISDRKVLEICRDKLLTFETLKQNFDLPFTTLNPDDINVFPIIAKPRYGKGSRDILKINDKEELQFIAKRYNDMIYQDYLPGEEFTIDVLSDLSGNPLISIPRVRIQTKSGISTKGRIMLNKYLIDITLKIAKFLKIIGPCCIQMKRDINNKFKLVEINPRLGGGTIFTTLAGANFPSMIIDMAEGKPIIIPKILEITILRYYDEIVLDKNKKILRTSEKTI